MPDRTPPASALLVVDKPAGITSHQVVARARRALGTRRIGHAGTLDPLATGVLVLGVEKGTRLLGHLTLTTKTYEATIRLGRSTSTDDADGEPTATPGATLTGVGQRLQQAVGAYVGTFAQVPSSVSAIRVGGQRAYALTRRGEAPELAARPVTVSRFDVRDVRQAEVDGIPVVDVDAVVDCSSGTYVRALARDLGADLGVGGHLTSLRRTRVGPFTLAHATWDGELGDLGAGERLALTTLPLGEVAGLCFPVVEVDADAAAHIRHGRPLDLLLPDATTALVRDGVLLALYRRGSDGRGVPVAVLV